MDFFKIIKQVLDSVFWVLSLIQVIQIVINTTKTGIKKIKAFIKKLKNIKNNQQLILSTVSWHTTYTKKRGYCLLNKRILIEIIFHRIIFFLLILIFFQIVHLFFLNFLCFPLYIHLIQLKFCYFQQAQVLLL